MTPRNPARGNPVQAGNKAPSPSWMSEADRAAIEAGDEQRRARQGKAEAESARRPRLRGVVANAEEDRQNPGYTPRHWELITLAQEEGRALARAKKLAAGGDESLFGYIDPDVIGEPEPVAFSKSGLLLSEGIHHISAPPGAGKTRVAYWDALMEVRAGLEMYRATRNKNANALVKWAVFDGEMGPERYKQVLIQLGASAEEIKMFRYIKKSGYVKDQNPGYIPDLTGNGRALIRKVRSWGCSGIIYDSQTVFLAASGISENDPQGVRDWTISACSGIRKSIILDHIGYSDAERGRGTSDKAAGCDIDLYLKVGQPFAIGRDGKVILGISKDRSGKLPAGSEILVDVICKEEDLSMEFVPGSWETRAENVIDSVAEILETLLLRDEFRSRDYATATELQKAIGQRPGDTRRRIREAVSDDSIKEEKVGKSKHYSLP